LQPPRSSRRLPTNPSSVWVTQQARQFAWKLQEQSSPFRYLIRDRDSKFTRCFDAVLASEGVTIVKTPVRERSVASSRDVKRRDRHGGLILEYSYAA
jgi:hypothetical protein